MTAQETQQMPKVATAISNWQDVVYGKEKEHEPIDIARFKQVCGANSPELEALNEANRAAAKTAAAERRAWFTDDQKLNENELLSALKHMLWVNDDTGYFSLEDLIRDIPGQIIRGTDPLHIGDAEAYKVAKLQANIELQAAVEQCVLRTYNKDLAYLRALYRKIEADVDATQLQH